MKTKVRIEQLKAMHSLMQNANDEEIYMTWITLGVPDEPHEDDFVYIAEDDDATSVINFYFDIFSFNLINLRIISRILAISHFNNVRFKRSSSSFYYNHIWPRYRI